MAEDKACQPHTELAKLPLRKLRRWLSLVPALGPLLPVVAIVPAVVAPIVPAISATIPVAAPAVLPVPPAASPLPVPVLAPVVPPVVLPALAWMPTSRARGNLLVPLPLTSSGSVGGRDMTQPRCYFCLLRRCQRSLRGQKWAQ